VELKYFGGLTNAAIAKELDLATRTVDADLRFAKAWLHRRLASDR
jgi:DNA-directed RNA polymerase specialized sigma24 family protein